ncbi:outer mitochondrial membrane protein porin [Moniliophthora roreri MCA 2997]|uniref:Outer mitochondrial membrane protein porin n=2 Tax=Moniliophthora roreri TaxID=221103 RepID=V2Y7R3_MONRO|nr:outer mitochondrial membrane protein porin [Moniliophthora roreri MCA 2997]
MSNHSRFLSPPKKSLSVPPTLGPPPALGQLNDFAAFMNYTPGPLPTPLLELENQIAKDLKVDINTASQPEKGTTIGGICKQSGVHTHTVLNIFEGPTFTADTIPGRDSFLVGAEAAYNITEGNITRYASHWLQRL